QMETDRARRRRDGRLRLRVARARLSRRPHESGDPYSRGGGYGSPLARGRPSSTGFGVPQRQRARMKAIVMHRYGPPEVLQYETVPDPEPRAGEIRIRIHAATVNRVLDVSLRAGKETRRAPVLPLIPGVDRAGTVEALGPGVTRWKVGQRVAAAGGMPLESVPQDCTDYN